MTAQDAWTLDELIARVAQALADGYPGAPSGRVRDLPDARTVRWYVTRGLVDPPLGMRGRQALYGRRHLLQLVALKRRQAQGVPLAQIQLELAGLPDAALAEVAALPAAPTAPAPPAAPAAPPAPLPAPAPAPPGTPFRPGLPRPAPMAGPAVPAGAADGNGASPAPAADGSSRAEEVGAAQERVRFWAAPPAPRTGPSPAAQPAAQHAAPAAQPAVPGAQAPTGAPSGSATDGPLPTLHGIRLAPGVVLLLDADLAATAHPLDDAALRAAAVPLLALLHRDRTDEGTRR